MEVLQMIGFGFLMYIVLIGIPTVVEFFLQPDYKESLASWFKKFELHSFGR